MKGSGFEPTKTKVIKNKNKNKNLAGFEPPPSVPKI